MKKTILLLTSLFAATSFCAQSNSAKIKRDLAPYLGTLVSLDDLAQQLNLPADQAYRKALYCDKVVVDLYAPWCAPCKALTPALERMAAQHRDTLFIKVDIDQHPQIAKRYAVRSIPTIIYLKNGQQVGRVTGNDTREIASKTAGL